MNNLEHDLIASGLHAGSPRPNGIADWTAGQRRRMGDTPATAPSVAVAVWECNGPEDVGDLDPDVTACAHWDEEAGEPIC